LNSKSKQEAKMAKNIELTQKAGDLREEAHAKLADLRDHVERQADGELGEDETKLSPEEIEARSDEIEQLFAEAKGIEKVDSLEGLQERASRDPDQLAPAVREVLKTEGFDVEAQKEDDSPFPSMHHFLKGLRAASGQYDEYELTKKQRAKLAQLSRGAQLTVSRPLHTFYAADVFFCAYPPGCLFFF
jgi:hypothetical protein